MAVVRDFIVKLLADPKQVVSAFNKIQGQANQTFGSKGLGGKLSALMPSFKTISIAGTAAFGAVTAAAGFAIKAAAEDAESQAKLAQTLKTTFGESELLREETERLITQFSKSAAVADDQLRPAFGNLIRSTGDFTQSQKLLQIALDISAGTGRDLESVTIALSRASQGQFTALTRLGVPLDQNAVKTKNFDKVVGELADTFKGQAEVQANSAAGRFRAFGIAVDELKEQFGTILLPVVTQVVDFLTDRLIPAVSLAIDQFRSQGVRAGLAYFVAAFGEMGKAVLAQIQSIGNGIFAFLNGVVGALAPLFAAIDAVRAFLAFGKPIVSIQGMVKQAQDGLNAAFAEFGADVDYATKKLDIMARGPLDNVERRLQANKDAAIRAKGSITDFGDETDSAGKKAAGAAKKIKTAEEKLKEYSSAAKSAKSASDAYGRSQQSVAKAQQSVFQANQDLAKAQEELAAAQMGGDPATIEAAQRRLAAAERGVARSKFGVEESLIAVRDAERRLAEVRADAESTPDDIRKAEIALAEAQFSVADAQDSVIQETLDLNEARRQLRISTEGLRAGDEELLPFLDAVRSAQENQQEAVENLTEAIDDQREALQKYQEALAALAQVSSAFPKISAQNPVTGLIPQVPAAGAGSTLPGSAVSPQQTLNVIVQSGVLNGAQVGEEIYQYLRDYERVNGPLNFMV
jgi:tetratricopeptide (TPR) repeat protein